jgi:hypothetical protein
VPQHGRIAVLERQLHGQQLVRQYRQHVLIRRRILSPPPPLFRRHVRTRATRTVLHTTDSRHGRLDLRRQAEVQHLHRTVGPHHHVRGLDVAVQGFEGHLDAAGLVEATEDHAHAALTEFAQDAVAAQNPVPYPVTFPL